MVTAVAADEFEHVGVAAFGPALHDADRLAPQDDRPPQRGLINGSHGYLHGAPSEPEPTGPPSSVLLGNLGHVIDYVADALAVPHPYRGEVRAPVAARSIRRGIFPAADFGIA
jgi:hypothetical protein